MPYFWWKETTRSTALAMTLKTMTTACKRRGGRGIVALAQPPSQPPLTLFPAKGPVSWGRDLPSKHGAQHCTWPPPCSVPFRGRFPHLSAISHVHGGTWMKYDNPVGLGVRGISSSRGHPNPTTGRWWAPESGCRLSKGLE